MSLTKVRQQWNGVSTWRLGDEVKILANKNIYTNGGNLQQQYNFKDVKADTSLLSIEWLKSPRVTTVTTHWVPTVSNLKPDAMQDFTKTTAENVGLEQWEVAKLVMERCLRQFGAHLLEVTLWGVKLGHSNLRSAQEVKDKKREDVVKLLTELLADTEYLYRDAVVEWTVTVDRVVALEHTPVQESGHHSRQDGTCGTSLEWSDHGGQLIPIPGPELDVQSEFDFSHIGRMDDSGEHSELLYGDTLTDTDSYGAIPALLQQESPLEGDLSSVDGDTYSSVKRDSLTLVKGVPTSSFESKLPVSAPNNKPAHVEKSPQQSTVQHRNQTVQGHSLSGTTQFQDSRKGVERSERNNGAAISGQENHGRHPARASGHTHNAGRREDVHRTTTGQGNHGRHQARASGHTHSAGRREDVHETTTTPGGHSQGFNPRRTLMDDNNNGTASGSEIKDNSGKPRNLGSQNVTIYRQTSAAGNTGFSGNNSNNKTPSNKRNDGTSRQTLPLSGRQQHSPGSTSKSSPSSARGSSSSSSSFSSSLPKEPASPPRTSYRGSPDNGGGRSGPVGGGRSGTSTHHHSGRSGPERGSSSPERTKSVAQERSMKIECDSAEEARLVKESVDRAYLDDAEKAPKAKSFDTMLCLDISESMMQGGAFDQMKRTVLEFIDGVEDAVTASGVEENMGLVTFGGRANVVQNLTNDFNRIRDQIDLMKPGGKSPFVEALLVAMAAFVRKGGIVSVSGEWEVKPRIIFISDGLPTESSENFHGDFAKNITNVRLSLSRMLISFKDSDNFNKVHPVVFVPVGTNENGKSYMGAMSKICDGMCVQAENIRDLCHYFRVQETIGKVLVCLKRESEGADVSKIDATVTALTPDISAKEKAEVLEVVARELNNPARARTRQHPKPNDFDSVFEDTDKVNSGERLPLGTRVIRGPDWNYGDQDGGGPGTVINHHEKHSIHWVQWDNADYNCYPFSSRRGYHIFQTEEHPRLRNGNEQLEIGMTVKRGPDWKSSEALPEQGVGLGVIIRRTREKRMVMVRWSNGERQICQWSAHGPKEVEYCDPSEAQQVDKLYARSGEPQAQTFTHSPAVDTPVTFEGNGKWEWRDIKNTWTPYDTTTNQQIEAACKKKKARSCLIDREGKSRRVMFTKMVEKSIEEGSECEVRRRLVDNS
ncbi:uncharacterized protein [Littorina saxatilis]|uniref:uncharacterized protein isoform X3 n=1 Tax=Littorina saxatilis TaxID=31220 RepID=UPI0038B59FF6